MLSLTGMAGRRAATPVPTDSGDTPIVFTGSTLTAFDLGDVVTGGRGNDVFRFNGGADDHDLITDFRPGNDRLEIFLALIGIRGDDPGLGGVPEGRL